MNILVTGGTGYIGAHVVRLLQSEGNFVVIADDVETGEISRVPGVTVEKLDLAASGSVDLLTQILVGNQIDAVVHFAGRKQVFESVQRPAWYFSQNVGGLANLLLAMENAGVKRLVFSSSAAVYGKTEGASIVESDATIPVNPYGDSKLVGERLIESASVAFGLAAVSLRYFNVAGAGAPELGDRAVLNLVPMVFERIDANKAPLIFGDDYDTVDGTCIRDYIHVQDLAEAHLAVLATLVTANAGHEVYNVGTGQGTSVREIVETILRVSGSERMPEIAERRPGDPAHVVASAEKIRERVGWVSRFDLEEIVRSAWEAHVIARKAAV